MLEDIGHPFASGQNVYDITFENVQAGLRTDYLFRLANHHDGIVIGTGDLSELALGWCTYGVGDQMAHYNVNAGVPKTLIQHLIRWVIGVEAVRRRRAGRRWTRSWPPKSRPNWSRSRRARSPQSTEAKIGPYALQDFTLFYMLRYGFPPSKIAFLALHAWEDAARGDWPPHFRADRRIGYDLPQIRHWLEVFLTRFFAFSQFKRCAMPNGPKVSRRRVAVAARRLAGAVGRQCRGLAGGAGTERAARMTCSICCSRRWPACLAGSMNAVAGGGSFVTFPAMVLAGLPPIAANATSTVALFPGTLASTWAYRDDLRGIGGISLRVLLPISVAGGLLGAMLLLVTPGRRSIG